MSFQRCSSWGPKLPPWAQASDRGLPLCCWWARSLVCNWNLGHWILLVLLPHRWLDSMWHRTAVMVDGAPQQGSWWQERWAMVVRDADTSWSYQNMHNYHLGGFCPPCSCQFWAIPLCWLPSKPPNHKPPLHAWARHSRVSRAWEKPWLSLPENNYSPATNPSWCVPNRDFVSAFYWWDLPWAERHSWMDFRCWAPGSIWEIWQQAEGHWNKN